MFVIETSKGFVADFNQRHQIVQFTEINVRKMQFGTRELAQRWLDEHAAKDKDFQSSEPRIVKFTKEVKSGAAAKGFHNPGKRVL